jgi:hypothetical protein
MKKRELRNAELSELIAAYSEAAQIEGQAIESGDFRTENKASDLLAAIYSELRRRGREAQCALLPLLNERDPGIRLWAASHALDFSPSDGQPVLEALVPIGKFLGLCAKATLDEWRRSRLRFP